MEIRSAATRVARWAGLASGDPVPDALVRWIHAARAFLLVVPAYVLLFAALFGRTGVTIGAPVAVTSITGALSRSGRPDVRRHVKAAIAAWFVVWIGLSLSVIALADPFGRPPLPVAVALAVAPASLALAVFVAVTHLPVRRQRPVDGATAGPPG